MNNAPYLNFVRSFEAAARHLSFTAAAEELNYTQSAISHHVRSLEEFIGRPLFIRYPQSLALTTLGEAYLPAVKHALSEIDKATEGIITTLHDKKVTISCPISLAQNWLTGVVTQFNDIYPEIIVAIHGKIWSDDEAKVSDITLVSARKEDAPKGADLLWREKLTVVCAPNYKVKGRVISAPEDLREAQLIHMLGRSAYWQSFAEHFNITDWNIASGAQTNSTNVALELAASGRGCAIVPKPLIGTYIKRKLLIEPFKIDLHSPWSCYISNEAGAGAKPAQVLHEWLMQYQDI